jgi:hypothetical protein
MTVETYCYTDKAGNPHQVAKPDVFFVLNRARIYVGYAGIGYKANFQQRLDLADREVSKLEFEKMLESSYFGPPLLDAVGWNDDDTICTLKFSEIVIPNNIGGARIDFANGTVELLSRDGK